MTPKDSDDFIKDIFSEATGDDKIEVSTGEEEIKKKMTQLKKKKEEVKILELKVKPNMGYGKSRKSRYKVKPLETIESWGAFDFAVYVRHKCVNDYEESFKCKFPYGINCLNCAWDKLRDNFGAVPNIMFKDYIDFCFENYVKAFVFKANKSFYFKLFEYEQNIKSFYDNYDYMIADAILANVGEVTNSYGLDNDSIREAYSIDKRRLVSNYGIVISINWISTHTNTNINDVIKQIGQACFQLGENIETAIKKTEEYSPYPEWKFGKTPLKKFLGILKYKDIDELKIEFNNKAETIERFSFMRRVNETD